MAIDDTLLPKHLDDLLAREHIAEAVVVSTCNRTEIFVVAEKFHGAFADVRNFVSDLTFLPPDEFIDHLTVAYDDDAVRHLFSVAAGADSVVIGEHEILGQVRDAWETARELGASGTTLNLLFRRAVEVGKRARTETSIARHVTSVSHAGVIMAGEHLGEFTGQRAVVVGAGSMARGVVDFLAMRDVPELTILNRTVERAAELAEDGVRTGPLSQLDQSLVDADVAFFATSAPAPILDADRAAVVMERRGGRALLMVDISVPRNIDVSVAELDGVSMLDMDDLREFSERGISERRRELDAVSAIVAEEVDRFRSEHSAREVTPLIVDFRERADGLVADELARQEARLCALSESERAAVEAAVRGAVAKLLHEPTVQLKSAAGTPRGDRLATSLRELFDL